MKMTKQQAARTAQAKQAATWALRSARDVAFYNEQAERHEGETREALIRCAVTARKSMEENLRRFGVIAESLADGSAS